MDGIAFGWLMQRGVGRHLVIVNNTTCLMYYGLDTGDEQLDLGAYRLYDNCASFDVALEHARTFSNEMGATGYYEMEPPSAFPVPQSAVTHKDFLEAWRNHTGL